MICNIKSVFIDLHKAFWRDEGGIIYVLEGWGHNCLPILCCWMGWRRDHLSLRWWKGTAASPPAASWMEQTWDHVGLRKIRGRASLSSFTCLSHQTSYCNTVSCFIRNAATQKNKRMLPGKEGKGSKWLEEFRFWSKYKPRKIKYFSRQKGRPFALILNAVTMKELSLKCLLFEI